MLCPIALICGMGGASVTKGDEMIEGTCHCGTVSWAFDGDPGSATACNCTTCRRYGTLWIYDYEGERIRVSGPTNTYERKNPVLRYHFCARCGCMAYWRGIETNEDGRRRIAVNVRLADPAVVAHLPIDHFDGLDTFEDLPRDGRRVSDMWF